MFAEAIEDILRDHCTPARVRAVDRGDTGTALWERIRQAGFLDLLAGQAEGGAELALPQVLEVMLLIGRYAVPLPLAQSMAARVMAPAGIRLPESPVSMATSAFRRDDGALVCPLVPHGLQVSHVLLAYNGRRMLLDAVTAQRLEAGTPARHTATLQWPSADAVLQSGLDMGVDDGSLAAWCAALHAVLIAGAMARVFEMTLDYCNEREQFGRPLGKFQSVQHQLSVMAQQVVAASIAAQAAFQGQARSPGWLPAALAKSRASEGAVLVANAAHALHGAIGVTADYDLQLYTRRLHEWRLAHGSEHWWNQQLGQAILASGQGLARFVHSV
jgi:acyl-CoA dehydrogenase